MKKAVDGLILRELPTGESDKLLTVLTAEGRFLMTAKGARSMRSKVMSLCTIFTYGNFEYYEKEIKAPVAKNQVVGKVVYYLDEKEVDSSEIVCLEDVDKLTFFEYFIKFIKNVF